MVLANRSCNLVSEDKLPKSDCNCELVGFRCLEELGSKLHFVSRTRVWSSSSAYDFTPENSISGNRFSL